MRIYPAGALHDGRPLGRLRPAVLDPGPVRDPARPTSPTTGQPARGQRVMQGWPTATSCCQTRSTTTWRPSVREDRTDSTRRGEAVRGRPWPDRQAAVHQGLPHGRLSSTRSWVTSCGTTAGWSGPRRACGRRSARSGS
jgi:hypothetical protein